MATVTLPTAEPLTLEEIQDWIRRAEKFPPYGEVRPFNHARVEIGRLLGISITDRAYHPDSWLALLRRARRVLATQF